MSASQPNRSAVRDEPRRANPMGAYVTTAGAILFLIATFLDWVSGDDESWSGYETDTTIPLMAYFGVGFSVALLYAANRATRRQHRGLSLSSMAAGVAATALALSYLIETPGAAERAGSYDSELGIYVGLIGALVWTIGSYLLAKEPEGDIEHDRTDHHDKTRSAADTHTDRGRGGAGN